ncbi:MaoC/PaaZ C-terminal domain-containing protein [Alteromonas sp. ASW11-19]|uniref:MaoC/PaaZ C-terminal domain-containing protein n=1 Tax=Alteromonas salexigens TaxID=2982530 RepID=A0ABT2VQZ8_9ALTE|nr:MaoC/PaaZ C-terminal domain-containing protein [Alteromonas salexigens]MCU7555738.1 MaoC/PaaZ C-terminal domain-containing protein [Alteromonas salexigens]
MISLYTRALLKRTDKRPLQQFKPPPLPGRTYSRTVTIDNDHYTRYCQLTRWPASSALHPCYLQTLSLPLQMQCLLDKRSPFPLLGLVHTKNSVSQRAVNRAVPLELRVRFSAIRQHPKGWECDVQVSGLQSGSQVYEATSTYLTRVKASHVVPGRRTTDGASQQPLEQEPLARLTIPASIGRQYARVSGDYNPIHLHGVTAKLFGFRQPIAHGMWTLARSFAALPQNNLEGSVQLQAVFEKPVFLPASVLLHSNEDTPGSFTLWSEDGKHRHLQGSVTALPQ